MKGQRRKYDNFWDRSVFVKSDEYIKEDVMVEHLEGFGKISYFEEPNEKRNRFFFSWTITFEDHDSFKEAIKEMKQLVACGKNEDESDRFVEIEVRGFDKASLCRRGIHHCMYCKRKVHVQRKTFKPKFRKEK